MAPVNGPTDALLGWLKAARAGSADALGEALQAYRGYLLLIAEEELDPDLRAKAAASDVVQETFVKAQRDFAGFRGGTEAEWRAWLRRILVHTLADLRDHYRGTAKRRLDREVALARDDSSNLPGGGLAGDALTPSKWAIEQEQAAALGRVLAALPEDYRVVLRLRYEEGQSFEDISRLMNRSVNAVQKLWARAVARVQQDWDAQHERERPSAPG
jgi:RNA polymerase sigma-70 factor (ECF subfamily)